MGDPASPPKGAHEDAHMFEVPPKGAHDASRPKGAHEGAHVVRVLGAMDRVEPEPAAPCVAVGAAGRNRRDGSGEASRRASVWRGARQGGKVWEVGLAYEVWRAAVGGCDYANVLRDRA